MNKTEVTVKAYSSDPRKFRPTTEQYIVPGLPADVATFQKHTLEHMYKVGNIERGEIELISIDDDCVELTITDPNTKSIAFQITFRKVYNGTND